MFFSIVRYGSPGQGWVVSGKDKKKAKIKVNLQDPVTGESPYISGVIVHPALNVKMIKIEATKILENGNSVDLSSKFDLGFTGEISFQQAFRLSDILIKFTKLVDKDADIEVKVGIKGCFTEHSKCFLLCSYLLHTLSAALLEYRWLKMVQKIFKMFTVQ